MDRYLAISWKHDGIDYADVLKYNFSNPDELAEMAKFGEFEKRGIIKIHYDDFSKEVAKRSIKEIRNRMTDPLKKIIDDHPDKAMRIMVPAILPDLGSLV